MCNEPCFTNCVEFTDTERIDVTIIRLEEIESEKDTFFEGLFIP